ncbi:MAG: type II toxin-antitoxin system VapC family toxin [Chloroflexi bacterium]|nr:type II toxin-antitoxin system VapC family toxin [Chloroflexota bacterium]
MSRDLFVDTSAWYALAIARDLNNRAAKTLLGGALDRYRHLISTNHVIGETYTLIRHRWGHEIARVFLENMRKSRRLRIAFVSERQETDAYGLLAAFPEHDLSFVDGTSMVIMRENSILECFTFDRHFAAAGFRCLP